MRILLSNDDGYEAAGIRHMAAALEDVGEVIVVAPDRDRSGASNSLTLVRPLRVRRMEAGVFRVDGTPTDCVHLALTGMLDVEADMVISGINHGANLGDDVLYSGTVAAAMEGRFLGLPAIAVSLAGERPRHFESAARAVLALMAQQQHDPLPADTILNVNVPNLAWNALSGFEATRLGLRHRAEPVIRDTDPRGEEIFWVGPAGREQDAGPGTDFHAVHNGYISVTPMQVDLTRYTALDKVANWLEGMKQ